MAFSTNIKPNEAATPITTPQQLPSMPGFTGQLNSKILQRVDLCARAIGITSLRSKFPHLDSGWRRKALDPKSIDIARFVDHTILKPEATREEVRKLCDEAKKYNFFAVCVNGCRVD